jgi:lysyl-tRNA synthetase, class II
MSPDLGAIGFTGFSCFSKQNQYKIYNYLTKWKLMDYSKESIDRQQKIQNLKDAGVICYADSFHGKQDIDKIRETSESRYKEVDFLMENWAGWEFKTAGRIISSRGMWKLTFAKLMDNTGDIQICFMRDMVSFNTGRKFVKELEIWWEMKSAYKIAEKFCQVWDYIWITGDLFLTKHGEITLFVKEFQILSKAVRPLPEKFHWVKDIETIYRQRYLDLIMNDESYKRFLFRSKFIKTLRDFYEENNFIEIETPVLWNAASWAAAAPFTTHHNDFDEDYFLRISPETALKKAMVWRFERVVEFARDFRNEWSDPSHLQEFSMIEHYAAWWNFEDNMKFTEEMFDFVFEKMNLDRKIKIKDKEWNIKEVDFKTPFERIDYIAWVKEKSWIDISLYNAWDEAKLRADIKSAGYNWEWIDKQATATMIDYLYKKVLRLGIVWPAFVYNYPKTMQPLARQSDQNENIVEQFQMLLNGWEVLKAYSELVDPKIQQEKFDEQSGALAAWDEEATSWDDDFVLAMEYWMPCQSWWGMWIDRIVSLLTEQENLRDVVLFPIMKSLKDNKKEEENI